MSLLLALETVRLIFTSPARSFLSSSVVPSAATTPLLIITILSQVASASLKIWVDKITVFFLPISFIIFLISCAPYFLKLTSLSFS